MQVISYNHPISKLKVDFLFGVSCGHHRLNGRKLDPVFRSHNHKITRRGKLRLIRHKLNFQYRWVRVQSNFRSSDFCNSRNVSCNKNCLSLTLRCRNNRVPKRAQGSRKHNPRTIRNNGPIVISNRQAKGNLATIICDRLTRKCVHLNGNRTERNTCHSEPKRHQNHFRPSQSHSHSLVEVDKEKGSQLWLPFNFWLIASSNIPYRVITNGYIFRVRSPSLPSAIISAR